MGVGTQTEMPPGDDPNLGMDATGSMDAGGAVRFRSGVASVAMKDEVEADATVEAERAT